MVFLHKFILHATVGGTYYSMRVAWSPGKGISELPSKFVHRCLPPLCGFRREDVG